MRGRATPRKCIDIPLPLRSRGYIYRKESRKTRAKNGFNKILTARFNKALTKKIRIHVGGQACPGERASRRAGRRAHERAQASGRGRAGARAGRCAGVRAGAGVWAGRCRRAGRCARVHGRVRAYVCTHERARVCGLNLPTLIYINPLPSASERAGVCARMCVYGSPARIMHG